jgi:hypothetical protein
MGEGTMATKYFDGSTDGNLGTAANWTPSGVPEAGDDLVFDGRTTQDADEGLSTFATIDLGSITIESGYTGDIGAVDDPMEFQCAGTVYIAGTGTYYLQCDAGADADADVVETIINGGTVYLSSQANDETNAAVWTLVQVLAGTVYIQGDSEKSDHGGDSGCAITTLWVTPVGNCTVRIGDKCMNYKGADTPMDVIISGGTLTSSSSLGDVLQTGGTLNFGSASIDMATADDDITTLTLVGGTFNWIPQSTSGTVLSATPTIASLNVVGGTFDATSCKDTASSDPTITTVWQYGGIVDLRNIFANFAVTTYHVEGGSLHYSPGQVLTLS